MLVSLMCYLAVVATTETILPSGEIRAYVRYFLGLLTLLYLLNFGTKVEVGTLWGELNAPSIFEQAQVEESVTNHVRELVEERVSDDVLSTFPECASVTSVSISEDGEVIGLELVTNGFVSRSALSERYGIPSQNIVIRGEGET